MENETVESGWTDERVADALLDHFHVHSTSAMERTGSPGVDLDGVVTALCKGDGNVAHAIIDRVRKLTRRLEELGLIGQAPKDSHRNSPYRVLTHEGWLAYEDKSYRHLLLGATYTLGQKRFAVWMLTVKSKEGDEEPGSACHVGHGVFVTCGHCVREKSDIKLVLAPEGNELMVEPAELLHISSTTDVAVLRSKRDMGPDFSVAPTIRPAAVLDPVLVLHYPSVAFRHPCLMATSGEVNAITKAYTSETLLAISAKTAPGSSGGALLNMAGQLGGLVTELTGRADSTNGRVDASKLFYFAVPAHEVRRTLFEAGLDPLGRPADSTLT